MSSAQTETAEQPDLGSQMYKRDQHTLDDNRVRGQISSVERNEELIEVTVEVLTTGETLTTFFEMPPTWSRTHEFVRLVEWCGYNSASSEQIVGEEVPLRNADGDWELDISRLPGEGILENPDYYRGVLRGGFFTLVYFGGLAWSALQLGYPAAASNMAANIGFALGAIFWLAIILHFFILLRPDDDREQLSWSEVKRGEFGE